MSQLSPELQTQLVGLMRWRRDLCRFRNDPVGEAVFQHCLDAFCMASSMALSEPKPSGMREAPLQLVVFCEENTDKGPRFGAATMPGMRRCSVVAAIMLFWLAAQAQGLGIRWMVILAPVPLADNQGAPGMWALAACLCIGWPTTVSLIPMLQSASWKARATTLTLMKC